MNMKIKTLGIVALALATVGANANPTVLFTDDFDAGSFSSSWFPIGAQPVVPTIVDATTGRVYEGTNAAAYANAGVPNANLNRFAAGFTRQSAPGETTVLQYWHYDGAGIGRHYLELRDYGTPTTGTTLGASLLQLLAIGINSNDGLPTGAVGPGFAINNGWVGTGQASNRYRSRTLAVAAGSGVTDPAWTGWPNNFAPNWAALGQTSPTAGTITRSEAWKLMTIVHSDTRVEYYVDGALGFFWDHNRASTIDTVVLGTGLSSTASVTYYDQVVVRTFNPLTVSVNVRLLDFGGDFTTRSATVELLDSNSNVVATTTAAIDAYGTVQVAAPSAGTYSVRAIVPGWLGKRVDNVNVADIGVHGLVIGLKNGDINRDNEVGPSDFAALAAAFGSFDGDPNWNADADLNADLEVGPADFAILAANFGEFGD